MNRPFEILLVEDNVADVRLIKDLLKEGTASTNLNVARDGNEALEYIFRRGEFEQAVTPDLILLDLNLPEKHGRDVLREIKADLKLRKIPVIVLTTSGADDDIASCYDLHANCYIRKPVDLDRFIQVMKGIEDFWLTTVELPSRSTTR